jgi:hypothetical protein
MNRRSTLGGIVVALVALACVNVGSVAWGAPAPVNPGPTAAHPYQGLRRLTVATVPPVPGIPFAIDGRVFTADSRGVATILITKAQREALRADRSAHLTVVEPVFRSSPVARARFTGWSGDGQYRSGGPVLEEYQRATFDIDYLTSFRFTTTAGDPVAAASLRSMRLLSTLGDRVTVNPAKPLWLQGSRTATGALGLQSQAVSYRVQAVRAAGVNAVNRGQQQFFPSRQHLVDVALLFFDVHFIARDALLGSSAGSSLRLQYPDGRTQTIPLRGGRSVVVRDLPRGTYHVTVRGAGPEMSQKLTVSKNQTAEFDTVTWIDIGLGVALLLVLVIGLLVVRRLVRTRDPRRPVDLVAAERAERSEELVGAP